MQRLRSIRDRLSRWLRSVAQKVVPVIRRGGRTLRIGLSVAWILIMLVGSFTVFRMTYGRPWFSAPAAVLEAAGTETDSELEPGDDDESEVLETDSAVDEYLGPGPGELVWPVGGHGSVVMEFGLVSCPTLKRTVHHNGIDLAAASGTEVRVPYDGIVVSVSRDLEMGNQVRIDHGGGVETVYASLDQVRVVYGQHVKTGQVLGSVGNSGLAEVALGDHLHFEVHVEGQPVNPIVWLKSD